MSLIETLYLVRRRLRARLFSHVLGGSFYSFGKASRIVPPFRGANLRRISVGADTYIGEGCWMEVIPGFAPGPLPVIVMGDKVRIGMDVTITAARSVIIEDHVGIARNVFISDHGHEFRDPDVPIMLQGVRKVAAVRICRGSWLGHGVVIMPGVTVGRNAVVGANSVVTDDIPDESVAVGAPARVVSRFDRESARWEKVPSAAMESQWRRSS